MEALDGRTAVVTGAASGMGFAFATRFAQAGMNLVMADIDAGRLEEAAAKVRASGTEVLAVTTDVADGDQVDALAARATSAFGPVHLLCNNAGVGTAGMIADLTTDDWSWVLGVNLWGVIHGLRAFLPGMLAHGEPGHIVNTASMAGLISFPFMGPYCASKFAVVGISEALHHEMAMAGGKIGVSVLCPGVVNTNIHECERNRPGGPRAANVEGGNALRAALANGLDPGIVAEQVYNAVIERRFYVLTHPELIQGVETRMRGIVAGGNPSSHLEELFAATAGGAK